MSSLLHIPRWKTEPVTLPVWDQPLPPRHVHVIPSLSLGGAEKIIVDLAQAWAECGLCADIVVLRQVKAEYQLQQPGIRVHRLGHLNLKQKMEYVAKLASQTELPIYCHLTPLNELQQLWKLKCKTVPVVHNATLGWENDPQHWNHVQVPFIVACGEQVAKDLQQHGVAKPVKVIRHTVPPVPRLSRPARDAVRKTFKATSTTMLIGMIGRIVPQKRYTRAIRLLKQLITNGLDAKLVIIGGTQGTEGATAKSAVLNEIHRLELHRHVILTGPLANASKLLTAFDLFLNTSVFEGVSIATMEAVSSGVPIVASNVGGQAEAIGTQGTLLAPSASDADWIAAIKQAKPTNPTPTPSWHRHMAAQIWPWSLVNASHQNPELDVLFITSNLDVGGAQRSLCNLVTTLSHYPLKTAVAISGPIGVPEFTVAPLQAGVELIITKLEHQVSLNNTSIPPNLFFLGPDARSTQFLPNFACFYMVSTDQGCPNASLEAMMSGVPIVANPDGGTSEQIIDQKTGILVKDPGDPQIYAKKLAQALAKLLTDKVQAKTIATAARRHVLTEFSMEKMANAYYQLFHQ